MAKNLLGEALKARKNAYAPYSKFKVGAALEAANGKIFTGCNVENATYGATCCAERVAIYKAVSEGVKSFKRIAIVADMKDPCPPCGICRQVLFEFSPNLEVIMANTRGKYFSAPLKSLLAFPFKNRKKI